MDIQHLKAFLLVAEHSSFSVAAEQLGLTQPAVSKRVATLEQQLATPLFDRIGRRVRLTEAGRALLPHARSITQGLDQALQSIEDLSGDVAGRLRLATSHHIGLHRLPPVLRRFSGDYPDVALDIDFMDSEQAYDEVTRGNVELAVVTLAPEVDPSLVARTVWPDPLDFMAPAGHPLCQVEPLDLAHLCQYPVILPGGGTYTGQIVRALFERRGLKLDIALSTNYLETIRMMASVGLGWTLLPRSMLKPPLNVLQVPGESPSRSLGLIYHHRRSLSNAARAFIAQLEG
jgi:DNA-binding transcriptional LysR family regulator